MTIPDPPANTIDPHAFANLLCDWCLDVRERDYVLVSTTTLAAPLIRAVHRALITRGAWTPGLRISLPGLAEDFYRFAPDELIDQFPPQDLAEMERADAYLGIQAPENTRALADIKQIKIRNAAGGMVPLSTLLTTRQVDGPVMVVRYNMYSAAAINGNAAPGVSSGQAITAAETVARETIERQDPTMRYEWTELALLQLQTGNTAMVVFILAVVLVFLVLAAQYES